MARHFGRTDEITKKALLGVALRLKISGKTYISRALSESRTVCLKMGYVIFVIANFSLKCEAAVANCS